MLLSGSTFVPIISFPSFLSPFHPLLYPSFFLFSFLPLFPSFLLIVSLSLIGTFFFFALLFSSSSLFFSRLHVISSFLSSLLFSFSYLLLFFSMSLIGSLFLFIPFGLILSHCESFPPLTYHSSALSHLSLSPVNPRKGGRRGAPLPLPPPSPPRLMFSSLIYVPVIPCHPQRPPFSISSPS